MAPSRRFDDCRTASMVGIREVPGRTSCFDRRDRPAIMASSHSIRAPADIQHPDRGGRGHLRPDTISGNQDCSVHPSLLRVLPSRVDGHARRTQKIPPTMNRTSRGRLDVPGITCLRRILPPWTQKPLHLDVLIFGGGAAGLWLLDDPASKPGSYSRGLAAGIRCNLGEGQTISSQGIIHGGLKYALRRSRHRRPPGCHPRHAHALAPMPRGRACLRPDLAGTTTRA